MKYLWRSMLTVIVLFVAGCGDLDQPDNPKVEGGKVVTIATAKQILKGLLDKNASGITKETKLYGYTAYSISYLTTDEEGNEIEASGLMTVPSEIPEEYQAAIERAGFSVVSDDHGTIFANRDAPTVSHEMSGIPQGSAVILTALNGFVTLQPDYIGFGDSSDHYHPYMLKKSLANSTIDFIKAARKFARDNHIPLNPLLFVTGYSEGGYAAMATMETIESDPALMKEMGVAMAAPMAGPYALDYMALGVLKEPKLSVPSFMANVGYAYVKAYKKPLDEVINEPYASKLPTLFSGDYNRKEIDPKLTHDTLGLFSQVFVADLFGPEYKGNPQNWFMQAVSVNSVYKWAPKTPTALLQCEGDDVIPYPLTQLAYTEMLKRGAAVSLVPIEKTIRKINPKFPKELGHGACGAPAYSVAAGIFSKIRKQHVGY